MQKTPTAVNFSNLNRKSVMEKIENEKWDVLIIGGGITGAGTALDMASRGLKVLLVEKHDFASGTSSRSTKLIHGGLRYLKQLELKLVREVGKERAIVHKNAPYLVVPEKMLLPVLKKGQLGKWSTSAALSVYDYLADVQKQDKKQTLNKNETLESEPLMNPDIVKSGFLYSEYRTDDARLVIDLLKAAVKHGATALNYLSVEGFVYHDNQIAGAVLQDKINNETIEIRADFVINATGPWVDGLRKIDGSLKKKKLHLTRGVHIVVERKKFPLRQAVYFDTLDNRMIFAIPRERVTYIGTTDNTYTENIENPGITKSDVKYLLESVNRLFTQVHLKETDIESTWSGLRPLIHEDGKSPSELSRKDEIFHADSGLISIAGGKLTGYRKMAERLTDYIIEKKGLKLSENKCKTQKIKLPGADGLEDAENLKTMQNLWKSLFGENEQAVYDIYYHRYGLQLHVVLEKTARQIKAGLQPFYALLLSELEYAVHHEMIAHPNDFFIRRTGSLYFDRPYMRDRIDPVVARMADYFNFGEEIQKRWKQETMVAWKEVMEVKD